MKGGWPTLAHSTPTFAVPSTNAGGVTQVSPARKRWESNPKRAVFLSADFSPSLRLLDAPRPHTASPSLALWVAAFLPRAREGYPQHIR